MELLKKHQHFFDKVDMKVYHLKHKIEKKHDKGVMQLYYLLHYLRMTIYCLVVPMDSMLR